MNNSQFPTKKVKRKTLHAGMFVILTLILVVLVAAFAMLRDPYSKPFRGEHLYVDYTPDKQMWYIAGTEITSTETKTLTGGVFRIIVNKEDGGSRSTGSLHITATDTQSGEILSDETIPRAVDYTVDTHGKGAQFKVVARDFSGDMRIYETNV